MIFATYQFFENDIGPRITEYRVNAVRAFPAESFFRNLVNSIVSHISLHGKFYMAADNRFEDLLRLYFGDLYSNEILETIQQRAFSILNNRLSMVGNTSYLSRFAELHFAHGIYALVLNEFDFLNDMSDDSILRDFCIHYLSTNEDNFYRQFLVYIDEQRGEDFLSDDDTRFINERMNNFSGGGSNIHAITYRVELERERLRATLNMPENAPVVSGMQVRIDLDRENRFVTQPMDLGPPRMITLGHIESMRRFLTPSEVFLPLESEVPELPEANTSISVGVNPMTGNISINNNGQELRLAPPLVTLDNIHPPANPSSGLVEWNEDRVRLESLHPRARIFYDRMRNQVDGEIKNRREHLKNKSDVFMPYINKPVRAKIETILKDFEKFNGMEFIVRMFKNGKAGEGEICLWLRPEFKAGREFLKKNIYFGYRVEGEMVFAVNDFVFVSEVSDEEFTRMKLIENAKRKLDLDD